MLSFARSNSKSKKFPFPLKGKEISEPVMPHAPLGTNLASLDVESDDENYHLKK